MPSVYGVRGIEKMTVLVKCKRGGLRWKPPLFTLWGVGKLRI
jgi:hypothetical protein